MNIVYIAYHRDMRRAHTSKDYVDMNGPIMQ